MENDYTRLIKICPYITSRLSVLVYVLSMYIYQKNGIHLKVKFDTWYLSQDYLQNCNYKYTIFLFRI